MRQTLRLAFVAAIAFAIAGALVTAKVKVKTQHDKSIDFAPFKTFAWHPDGAGQVKMLQVSGDDPEKIRVRLEPVIKEAVEQMLAGRGLTAATSGQPALYLNYYLLFGPGVSSQYMGQFIGSVPEWGLPPFSGPSTSFEAYEQGTLIIDVISSAAKTTIWRGSAQTEIDRRRSEAERHKVVRDAIAEMFKKFPPKK